MTDLPHRLREALVAADYTFDAVAGMLGPVAHAALGRNETTPGLARTGEGSPLSTLTRLFLLQAPVARDAADAALPGLVDVLVSEGILAGSGGEVRARLDVRPYAAPDAAGEHDLWVVSDLTPGLDGGTSRVGSEHVLGISSASTSLAQLTLREPVRRALDLGTGCGVQALHLARHAEHVVATDVNPRALWVARFNAALNGMGERIEVRDGSFFEPVAGEEFDLVATNPPFVISPGDGERLVYRDSGLPGDRVVEDIVRAAPRFLAPGGWCQVLANWVITEDRAWDERLADWLDGCDAFVVQREVLDPAAYVELWLKDSGRHGDADYSERYDAWLAWLVEQGVEAIGFGWINLRKHERHDGSRPAVHRFDDWPWEVEQPVAPAVAAWGSAVSWLCGTDDAGLLAAHLRCGDGVQQETVGVPGAGDPEAMVLRQQHGMRRGRRVDTVLAALVGACDGELSVGQVLDALGQLLEADADGLRTAYLPQVRELVEEGFLVP